MRMPLDQSFQTEISRPALVPLIGDPINTHNRPRAQDASRWSNLKALFAPDKGGAAAAVAAFRKSTHYTSNSKFFVLSRDEWESHEGMLATTHLILFLPCTSVASKAQ